MSDKSNKIEQPKEINVRSDSPIFSSMSIHGASITTVLPDKERIPRKIKIKKISETLIKVKKVFKNQTTQVKGKKRMAFY